VAGLPRISGQDAVRVFASLGYDVFDNEAAISVCVDGGGHG
jgi:hypothetical protein